MIISYYWKLFFSAYWFAFDFGEKKNQHRNASWFMNLTMFLNMVSCLFVITFFCYSKPTYSIEYIILSMIITSIFNEFILISKKYGYENKIKYYSYLSLDQNKKSRNKELFIITIFTFLLFIISLIINNHDIKNCLLLVFT